MLRTLAALLCCACVLAAGAPTRLLFAARPLPPYMEATAQGWRGSHIEIAQALAQKLGVNVEFVECPLIRCLRMLDEGSVDISMGLVKTKEREQGIHFLDPAYAHATRTVFYLRLDERRPLRDFDDLTAFRIGMVRGLVYAPDFDRADLKRDFAPDMETNFRKLLAGHIDVVPVGANVGPRLLARLGASNRLKLAEYSRQNSTLRQLSLSRRSAWFNQRQLLEQAMQELVNSGAIKAILDRYESVQTSACSDQDCKP